MGETLSGPKDESLEDELAEFYEYGKPSTELGQLYRKLKYKFHMSDEEIEEFLRQLSAGPA